MNTNKEDLSIIVEFNSAIAMVFTPDTWWSLKIGLMSKSFKIADLQIDTPILLAPMAGVTDYSFRILCKEQGAGIVYSEFVSADGIIRENEKTLDLIKFHEE